MTAEPATLELREVAPPEPLLPDFGLWPWWIVAGTTLLLVLVIFRLMRRRKSVAVDPVKLREAAYREAEAALTAVTAGSPRDAAVQASLVVRKYLSVAARDPALFETHEEFIARHGALEALNDQTRAAAGEGFARLAALKYAPGDPGTDAAGVVAESHRLLRTLHQGFAA